VVSLDEKMEHQESPGLEYIFHPQSIAVVGASTQLSSSAANIFIEPLLILDYLGTIYPVNPKGGELLGLKVYPTLASIPGPVDLAIICIPAPLVPQAIADCVRKGVKLAQIFTAGFSESGKAGEKLEAEIAAIARRGGIRVIGPNCMGIYCPSTGISFNTHFPKGSGSVGFLSQSGANINDVVEPGVHRGLLFSKVVSYGNACDLNECDFLEYLAGDPETEVIAMYIEGIRDGQRFVKTLAEATRAKPVVLLKGGRTQGGSRATLSHTSSLAGDDAVWDALCRQIGVIQAYNVEELIDILETFSFLKPPRGRNIALVGCGGGRGVLGADDCERAGLRIPQLSPGIIRNLKNILPEAGASIQNPIDHPPVMAGWSGSSLLQTLRLVSGCENIDLLLAHIRLRLGFTRESVAEGIDTIVKAHRNLGKPVAVALSSSGSVELYILAHQLQQEFQQAGVPIYPTVGRAAHAISKFIGYHEQRGGAR
jgi:acyl-CoA synthetase (NDP forming)